MQRERPQTCKIGMQKWRARREVIVTLRAVVDCQTEVDHRPADREKNKQKEVRRRRVKKMSKSRHLMTCVSPAKVPNGLKTLPINFCNAPICKNSS